MSTIALSDAPVSAAPVADPLLLTIPGNPVPEGVEAGYFETSDNKRLRFARWHKSEGTPKGTVCLVHGRSEFIEKYFETISDFRRRGFSVATFDWRGQGGSVRLSGNARLGHVPRFSDYFVDLQSFHQRVLLPDCPPPYYLVGHSMGGLVALHAAARDRMMFDRLFLSSPMLAISGQPFGPLGMSRLAGALSLFGLGRLPVGRAVERGPSERAFAANPLTSDQKRYIRWVELIKARPALAIGQPSLGWTATAMGAMASVAEDRFPGLVRIPTLMLAAPHDKVVSSTAIEHLGVRMRTGRHLLIPGGRHELFMESDSVRTLVLAAFDAFITNQSP